jgi:hypothetical protein
MEAEGWRHGPEFDECARRHDALALFESLDRRDRRSALIGVLADELEQRLAGAIVYERGPDREMLIEEMEPGLRVGLGGARMAAEEREVLGRILDWRTGADGELAEIRVKWDDGEVTDHHPADRELRREGW